ncbi:MAG TPA: hypothetical protein P5120_03060 [Spirochaetota bacterium]|nr:hypothetical protein [Spirochaetota bacterium]HPF04665.1 hypothetical protein [Spirochaetota bacterium]HPJ43211.1 hypothetical protein [Spirochaetota bacterium]HPR37883.1 hypothetical protein [Spirochaetota bacterium]HRX46474.1 hypothetical protein [Spirochaetota bacterium]
MNLTETAKFAGMVAGIVMPLFNIPLVYKIWKRKSSSDISLTWVLGVWSTILIMTPAAVLSSDFVFRTFGIINAILFTMVVVFVIKYR